MTIRNHADLRRCMLYIHSRRAKTGDQQYMRQAEDMIACEPRCVEWELQAIERATEIEDCTPLDRFRDRVREIMEDE